MKLNKLHPVLALVLIFAATCAAQIDTSAVKTIIEKSASENSFEGTILIADKGKIRYQESFGSRDSEKQKPVENDSRFGIASITKMVTAIIVLQLVEEDKLRLTDSLKTLLPNVEITGTNRITIHDLLLHISGLPNEDDSIYSKKKSPIEFVRETIGSRKPVAGYGKFNYANIDYVLLGLVIESIEGKSWQTVVEERLIKKLSLSSTGFLEKGSYPDNFAYSFSFGQTGNRKSDPLFHIENFYAAGSMYSTAADLLKLDQAMYGKSLLNKRSKELMFRSYPEYNYTGYSVWTYKYPFAESKPRIMERRGGILGSNSALIRMLDINRSIIILSNNNRFNPDSFGDKKNLREALIAEVSKIK
ncbi:MAG: serine hydrolase [Pyrinomonadaceae bacterium]|nr:serine hydrolase [Pyrinomonadaceae bacterium]